ncbi:hypothetical protein [Microlunatus sp. GCM10028923]|uniref:hypothetical protein n=1 Tax=Microlunatus sp. GCM10028923 TaxID=3273400 RepID=UPI0036241B37
MIMNGGSTFGRRTALVGAAGIAAALTLPAARAGAAGGYDQQPAFTEAQQAYLAIGFGHNEAGGYAWGESYFLLGLLRMYQAYGETGYLDTVVDRLDHLIATTDQGRGVTDYQGRSGPVWRTAGNYTASHGVITDAAGTPAIQVRWAGTRGAESTAVISESTGGTFTLTLRNPATATVITRTGLSLDPAATNYAVSVINAAYTTGLRWTAVDLRDQPGPADPPPAGTVTFASQYYVFAVHTGMVAYPLALFARIVAETKGLQQRFGAAGKRAAAAAAAAIAFHDDEFVIDDAGRGDYVWPRNAPIPFDGLIQPYNQSHGPGQAMVELYRVTKDASYRDRVAAMINSYAGGVRTDADGAYVWNYWPVHSELYRGFTKADDLSSYTPAYPAVRTIEDISHAAITTEFLEAAERAGIRHPDLDLTAISRTFVKNVIRSATQVWYRVDGTAEAVPGNAVQAARWMPYARYDQEVYAQCLRVYDAVQLVPNQGSHALGIGYLNWARKRGWERG